jgi:hypothetical protein
MDWKDLATGFGSVASIGWIAFAFFVARKALPHLEQRPSDLKRLLG